MCASGLLVLPSTATSVPDDGASCGQGSTAPPGVRAESPALVGEIEAVADGDAAGAGSACGEGCPGLSLLSPLCS